MALTLALFGLVVGVYTVLLAKGRIRAHRSSKKQAEFIESTSGYALVGGSIMIALSIAKLAAAIYFAL